MGEPSAVLLLRCSADTMSSRTRSSSVSQLASEPDGAGDGGMLQRAESFISNSQAVAAHYEDKRLLYTVRLKVHGCSRFISPPTKNMIK